jgi:uncharacterized membrane protein YgaE (UPF0421/DUF939 family)
MQTSQTHHLYAATAFVVATAIGWAALVPTVMSGTTFGWMAGVVFALCAVTLMSLNWGRSTRSMAHIINDAENPERRL